MHTNDKLVHPHVQTHTHVCSSFPVMRPHPHSPHSLLSARISLFVTLVSRCAMQFTIRFKAKRRDGRGGANLILIICGRTQLFR